MSEETIFEITPPHSPTLFLEESDTTKQFEESLDICEYPIKKLLKFRCFTCLGEAKLETLHLNQNSYLKNNENDLFDDIYLYPKNSHYEKVIHLFNETFDFGSVFMYNAETLFRLAKSEILYLHDAAKSYQTDCYTFPDFQPSQDYLKARRNCIELFLHIREYLVCMDSSNYYWIASNVLSRVEENLSEFRLFLKRIIDLPPYVLHHAANPQGNKCLEASYHLFHCILDMLWLHLTTLYLADDCRRRSEDNLSMSQRQDDTSSSHLNSLDHSVPVLIADLTQLAALRFENVDIKTLQITSPFTCSCVAEMWTLLQILTNKLHLKGSFDNFWVLVNKVLEPILKPESLQASKKNCMSLGRSDGLKCSKPPVFCLWLLKHLAMLNAQEPKIQCSNYPMLETVVKSLIASDVPEADLRVHLIFIEKIIIKYWEPKSDVIIILWEYFQKRLDSTFYSKGASVDSILVMSDSAMGMVKQVQSRLSSSSNCQNSFQMFLRILGLHLQRVTGQDHHWNQIRGRIYSKLSASKIKSLTEVGLYNIASLFLTLAVTHDLNEVCKKLQSLLWSVSADRDSDLVWRAQLALCILCAERGQDFTSLITPLVTALADRQQNFKLAHTLIDGLKDILSSGHSLKIDHSILFGIWMAKYLSKCSRNEEMRLLEVLQLILERVQVHPLNEKSTTQSNVWQLLSPYLKTRLSDEESPLQLADICLRLCQLSHTCSPTLKDILHHILHSNTANIGIIRRFLWQFVQQSDLLRILNADPSLLEGPDIMIIKGWIRCSLLSSDYKSCEVSRVTHFITHLPFIKDICMDLPSSSDPLKHFIVAVSNKYKVSKNVLEKTTLRQNMSRYLTGLEKWVEPQLKQPKSQEIVERIYHIIGLIFSLMPSFIYVKSRPNTVLKGLLDVMFLHGAAYKPGFEPSPHVKPFIAANIHLYISGLGHLGVLQDCYIDRCIEDLIKTYLPWVVDHSRSSLQDCLENEYCARLVLKTVCTTFVKRRATIPHPHCCQGLKFFISVTKRYSREPQIMHRWVDYCFEHVCDVIMFCDDNQPTKKTARLLLTSLFESFCFGDNISQLIMTKFNNLCQDYLPFIPSKLFGLFHEVLQYRPDLISRFLPELQKRIKLVEEKRGISFDRSLREYLASIEKALDSLRNGILHKNLTYSYRIYKLSPLSAKKASMSRI